MFGVLIRSGVGVAIAQSIDVTSSVLRLGLYLDTHPTQPVGFSPGCPPVDRTCWLCLGAGESSPRAEKTFPSVRKRLWLFSS